VALLKEDYYHAATTVPLPNHRRSINLTGNMTVKRLLQHPITANGLYGPLAFVVSNFLISLPFLFLISILFASVTYGLVGFRSDAIAFFIHVMWLFLDLVAAESLVVLVASLFPNFIVALTLMAFVNGL
jgi:ABC-type multidrug transport system permease subunit